MTRSNVCLIASLLCFLSWSSLARQGSVADVNSNGIQPGEFLTRWLVLGPLPVFQGKADPADQEAQRKAFDAAQVLPKDLTPGFEQRKLMYGGSDFTWKTITSGGNPINLAQTFGDSNFAIAYAWTQIDMPDTLSTLLGIGSDDGVKVWLNGQQVHDNWIGRECRADDDVVPVKFRKGPNSLLLKIQNMEGEWAFCVRALGPKQLTEILADAARRGDLDAMRPILEKGAPVNARNALGLTPLQAARIAGREDAATLLLTQGADARLPQPSPESLADALLRSQTTVSSPGAEVLVSKDGKIVYEKGFGLADVAKHVPITAHTRFRIGSITKQFTAAAILKLQEEGKLSVRDPLARFIPDFPRGNEVTLIHLLTHTSGIHSYTDNPDFIAKVTTPVEQDSLVAAIKTYPFDFNPGDRWQYSNSGYFLLGYIVGKVSGMPYGEFLKQNFFIPLKMTETGVHTRNAAIPDEAMGYMVEHDSVVRALDWDMSWAGGAGALYSTVGDLYRWNEGIFGGKVLHDSTLRAAWTPAKLKDGSPASIPGAGSYGFGWMIGKTRGIDDIFHGGGLHGFISSLARYPAEKVTVVALSNSLYQVNAQNIAPQIAELFLYEKMDNQASFASATGIDPKTYADYVGRYEYPQGAILSVTSEENRLYAQLTGQSRFEIFPSKKDEFYWKVVDAQVSFVRDEKGVVIRAIHHQGGTTFNAPKLADERPVVVNPALFDAYAGQYEIAPGTILTVTREGDRLFVQMTGQPKFEIFPRSDTEYFLTAVKADITFKKGTEGKVSGLTLKQAGMETPARRVK